MAKSTLEKYYISEKFDKERNVSFNFKKANQKISGNFKEFIEAVSEFIRVSEESKNDTRVWFHQNGAYRGSVNIEKARIILEKIKVENIENEKAIEYIEKADLVDKPAPKKAVKTEIKEISVKPSVDLESEAKKTVFFVENVFLKKASTITSEDVKHDSKYKTVVEKVLPTQNNSVIVYYHLENAGKKSETYEYLISGFSKVSSCVKVHSRKKDKKTFWAFFSILLILIVANLVLLALRLTNKI